MNHMRRYLRHNIDDLVKQSLDAGDNHVFFNGCKHSRGYGMIRIKGEIFYVHRLVYEKITGEKIPSYLEINHICNLPACFSFKHLEKITPSTNNSLRPKWTKHKKKYCKEGHEFTPESTVIWTSGQRMCKACLRQRELIRQLVNTVK
jgi:HNH endonuclease